MSVNAANILPIQSPISLKQVGCWQAQLSLRYIQREGKTILKDRLHHGPLTVQRPFYPEANDVCHTYLIHPPGGMVGGDHININVELEANAHVLVTTPSAGKAYQSTGAECLQFQHITLSDQAVLEWLPQEMIVFDGSKSRLITQVNLTGQAQFIGWDMVCLGRPASNDFFKQGQCAQSLQLYRDGRPLLIDRLITSGQAENRSSAWGLNHYSMLATMIATGVSKNLLESVQDKVNAFDQGEAGITLMGDVLVCRCLTNQGRYAKQLFTTLWQELRPSLLNKPAEIPRIWLT